MNIQFTKTTRFFLIVLSLLTGILTTWLIKDKITPYLLNGKSFENRSLLVQAGIFMFLLSVVSASFLFFLLALDSYCPGFKKVITKITHNHNFPPVSIVLLMCLANYFWGEIFRINNGIAWDALYYSVMVKSLSLAFIRTIVRYHVGRLFPVIVVHSLLRLFNMGFETDQITHMFSLYNMGILLVGTYFWGEILDQLHISSKGRWLGYIGFFINFAVLKSYFYAPIATDQTALIIGVFMLYFFLKRNQTGLLFTSIIGAFTWPTLVYGSFFLLAFPRSDTHEVKPAKMYLNELAAIIVALLILSASLYYYFFTKNLAETIHEVIILSILSTVSFIYLGTRDLLNFDLLFNIKELLKKTNWLSLMVAVLMFISIRGIISLIGQPDTFTALVFFATSIRYSLVRPFTSVIAHAAYLGPIVVIAMFVWKRFTQEIHRLGMGLTLFTFLFLLQTMLNPETRLGIPFFPFLVAFTVKAADDFIWDDASLRFIGILSFLYSRVWLRLNVQTWNFTATDSLMKFPSQIIFMNYGPWMSHTMYMVFGSLLIMTIIFFYFSKARLSKRANPISI